MALKDCIKKLRKAGIDLEPDDHALLEQYISEGLTDSQAVQRLLVENNQDIIDITDRVRALGGEVETGEGQLAEVRDFRTERLRSLMGKRSESNEIILGLNAAYTDMSQDASAFDELLRGAMGGYREFENMSETEAKMIYGQVMMRAMVTDLNNPGDIRQEDQFRAAMEKKTMSVFGLTPKEIYDSRIALQTRMRENRKEFQLVVQEKFDAQAEIDRSFNDQTGRELFQGPTDEGLPDIDANVSADNARIARILGPNMYGDMKEMGLVTVKELMQNAFDAARNAVLNGDIEEGAVDIDTSNEGRTITVKDNGVGMTPEHIVNGLLTIGGTMKEGPLNSGGFGFAKMLFLFGAKRIQVETVRDGVRSTMDVTGAEVIQNTEDQSVPLTIKREETTDAPGTTVTVDLPENYQDLQTGEVKEVRSVQSWNLMPVTDRQLLHPNVVLRRNGVREKSGGAFPMEEFTSLGQVQFDWGTADILISKAEKPTFPSNTSILVEGLRQLNVSTKENPMEMFGTPIQREIVIDIHPAVDPDQSGYPFHHNRQGLRPHAAKDIAAVQMILSQRNARDKAGKLAAGYGTVRTLDEDGTTSEPLDLTPAIDIEEFEKQTLTVNESDKIEVRGGVLYINGVEQQKLTKEQFAAQTFDVEKLKIPQERVPKDAPVLHNNQIFKEDLTATTWDGLEGKDLIEVLYEKFGERKVNQYFHGVGSAFIKLRNLLAIKGDQAMFAGLGEVGVGVSVLGDKFYGVHTKLPGQMMFINPGSDHREQTSRDTVSPEFELHRIAASSMMTTMIHEIAHFSKFGHGTDYIFALENAFSTTFSETGFIDVVLADLQNTFGENYAIYGYIATALEGGALENSGVSLKDLGEVQARDEIDAGDAEGQRGAEGRGPEGRALGEPSAEPAGPELDDAAIREGYRPGGVVAAPGSVHPNAGEDSALDLDTFAQDERGRITFNEARKGFIDILASGDSSTFIHETGHLYLEVMRWAAQQPEAPQQIRDDWETIKRHTGATDEDISTEAHEKFANGFEIYALEGKAPSIALQDSFNAFRRWMLTIYAKLRNIGGVHLNDEVRGVFDRMLATDAEIAVAEQSQGFVALFADADTANMTQEEFDFYAKQLQRTHDDAVEKESRRMLLAMDRDQKAWWAEERAKVRDEVEAEAFAMRVYRTLAMLQKGKQPDGSAPRGVAFKLDKASLMTLLSDDQETLNNLPRPFIYAVEGGLDVDVAASRLGYSDALAMIREIANAPKLETFIEAETEVRMRQRYPDPFTDGTLADNAVRAVHSEGRLSILAMELRKLRQLQREDRPAVRAAERGAARQDREAREANRGQLPKRAEMAMLKAGARETINTMMIRDIKPHVYLRAEQKAGRAAFAAMEKRDYQTAYTEKLKQIINHEMYRAALAVQKDMDSTRNFIARFEGPRKKRQLAMAGVLDQVMAVLESVDLRKRSLAAVDRDKALKSLKQAVLDGRMVVTPETLRKIMDETVNWQELTPEELHGLKDVLKQIEHGAVNEDKMTVNGELIDYSEAENELVESITENNKVIELRPGGQKTSGERANKNIDQGIMTWLRPSSIARVLDKAGFGAVTRRIIVPMRRAYAERLIPMLHQAQQDVAGFYRKHYTASELGKMSKRLYEIQALGKTYSRSELLSMALNWGNQGNRDAVLGGTYEGSTVFSQQAVDQMLAHLTVKDWAFVQDIWDYNDTYREEIFAAEERRRGIRPEKVEALPFTQRTADGETIIVRGGYHPLRYDRDFDAQSDRKPSAARAAENISESLQHLAVGGFVTASTKAGSTYARVKNHGRVVRLGLNIIDSHLREVIRDIAVGDEVLHIKRLLESGGVQRAMIDTNNGAALETLDLWLTDAAVGELPSENIWEFSAAWIRTGFTKAKLGWNFTVMFLQFTGLFQTVAVIGPRAFGTGLAKFMQNPAAAMRHVQEVSSFIKTRYVVGAFDKDVQDTKALVETEFGNMPTRLKTVYHIIGSTLFAGIAMAQKYVDVVTWLGSYEKGLNDSSLMLSEADAIIYADTQVEAAQTSGFFSDRSGLERGTTGLRKNRQSQFIRIWTTLISYMLAKSNIAYEKHKDTNYKDPKQVMELLFNLIMLYMVEGMASAWLYNRLPEDGDEPEDWALWALAQAGESAVTGVPFVREIAAARFGGGNTPIGVLSNDALRLIEQYAQGEADWASVDATLDVVGTLAHLPTGQISKTGKKLWEEGLTTDEMMEYFSGPRN